MDKISSEGRCVFCGKTFSKRGIFRHLNLHLAELSRQHQTGRSFHVKVESAYLPPYFLSLLVDEKARFEHIDHFLRGIWLECCYHASMFDDPQARSFYEKEILPEICLCEIRGDNNGRYSELMAMETGDIDLDRRAEELLHRNGKLIYRYDSSTTTTLKLTTMEVFGVTAGAPVVLLSRNEPLKIMCDSCHDRPAVKLCRVCLHQEEEEGLFCDECSRHHAERCEAFAEYAALPVANSPRAGACCYTGGTIDTERDGPFVSPLLT